MMADNRIQKDWDLETPDGKHIQVKYLSNPAAVEWPNWHVVRPNEEIDSYALVVFENLAPTAAYLFPDGDLSGLCAGFGKRHAHQDRKLQFTKGNHVAIMKEPDRFRALGVEVYTLPESRCTWEATC